MLGRSLGDIRQREQTGDIRARAVVGAKLTNGERARTNAPSRIPPVRHVASAWRSLWPHLVTARARARRLPIGSSMARMPRDRLMGTPSGPWPSAASKAARRANRSDDREVSPAGARLPRQVLGVPLGHGGQVAVRELPRCHARCAARRPVRLGDARRYRGGRAGSIGALRSGPSRVQPPEDRRFPWPRPRAVC